MQGKHLALLSKLEQLGLECNSLRTDLGCALHEREAMSHVLSELEHKCGQMQQQLIMEEVYHTFTCIENMLMCALLFCRASVLYCIYSKCIILYLY